MRRDRNTGLLTQTMTENYLSVQDPIDLQQGFSKKSLSLRTLHSVLFRVEYPIPRRMSVQPKEIMRLGESGINIQLFERPNSQKALFQKNPKLSVVRQFVFHLHLFSNEFRKANKNQGLNSNYQELRIH